MTKTEKILTWNLLYSLRHCFDDDGKLIHDYDDTIVFADLTKERKQLFDKLINDKLLR